MPRSESSWRRLFATESLPATEQWPEMLQGLRQAFLDLGPQPSLQDAKVWQLTLVQALRELSLPAYLIAQLISDHNDWIYRHTLRESLAEMAVQGWGEAPCRFAVLTLGSGARHESLLRPDQDNAMIIEDYPDDRHNEIDTWFQSLAERFTERLDLAGIPLCKGHVMARWPLWRKSLSQWTQQMRLWTGRRLVRQVQFSNIFLDFNTVYGDPELTETLRSSILQMMPRAGLFLDEMAELMTETPVALDRFERLVADGKEAPHQQALNLKRQGLLPLQSALRLLALKRQLPEIDCLSRIEALQQEGSLKKTLAVDVTQAFHVFITYLLEAQLQALEQGRQADGWIDLRPLTRQQQQTLRLAMLAVRDLQRLAAHSKTLS